MIDSLLQITGYEKVKMDNGKVIKQDPRTMLSCSAVAKRVFGRRNCTTARP